MSPRLVDQADEPSTVNRGFDCKSAIQDDIRRADAWTHDLGLRVEGLAR